MADMMSFTGAAAPVAPVCNAACTRQMSSALPYHSAPYAEAGECVRVGSGS